MSVKDAREPLFRSSRPGSRRALAGRAAPALALLAAIGAAACGGATSATPSWSGEAGGGPTQGPGDGAGGGAAAGDGGGAAGAATGLPCDVQAVLSPCTGCHGQTPSHGATRSLVTHDDLTAPSSVDPSKTMAERCVLRMQDAASPMPPGAALTASAADVATLQGWIDAGMPASDCGSPGGAPGGDGAGGADPFSAPPQCTSQKKWTDGTDGGKLMHPGRACITCHVDKGAGPVFSVAGTVYPSAHEPDDCLSVDATTAVVEIVDKNGVVVDLPVNASGNFAIKKSGFAYPYKAKVVLGGKERAMAAEQESGDCNACHTQDGASGAPGRILLP